MTTTTSSFYISTLQLKTTLGAILLGSVGAAILYGVSIIQMYFYVRKYQEDRTTLKCIIAFLWVMDTLHMAFIVVGLWHYLIDSFGDYQAISLVPWSHKGQQLLNISIVLTVQTLYAYRIWTLSSLQKIWTWPAITGVCLVCGYAVGTALVVKTFKLQSWRKSDEISLEVILAFPITTFNDFLLAIGICRLVFLSRPALGTQRRTTSMMRTIMRYVLISGMLTSMCSLAGLISFCVMPDNWISLALSYVITKLYVNSYLAMLNARESIRNQQSDKTAQLTSLVLRVSLTDPDETTAESNDSEQGCCCRCKTDRTVAKATPVEVCKNAS